MKVRAVIGQWSGLNTPGVAHAMMVRGTWDYKRFETARTLTCASGLILIFGVLKNLGRLKSISSSVAEQKSVIGYTSGSQHFKQLGGGLNNRVHIYAQLH